MFKTKRYRELKGKYKELKSKYDKMLIENMRLENRARNGYSEAYKEISDKLENQYKMYLDYEKRTEDLFRWNRKLDIIDHNMQTWNDDPNIAEMHKSKYISVKYDINTYLFEMAPTQIILKDISESMYRALQLHNIR